jgi:phosphate transport system protein
MHNFIRLLDELKVKIARMGAMVQQSVEWAADAVVHVDVEVARRVVDADQRIDEDEVLIEKAAIDLLALHQPTASDLRLVTSIIKANNDYERMADCSVNIGQRVIALSKIGDYQAPEDLRVLANTVVSTARDTVKAFNMTDEALARTVVKNDDVADALYHQIVQDMLALMQQDGRRADVDLSNIMIAKNFERIADHCTNIAEDIIYVYSGRIVRHRHAV